MASRLGLSRTRPIAPPCTRRRPRQTRRFTSLGSFSSRFRELVGDSPSAYQARFAASGIPPIPGCFVFMHGLSDRRPAAPGSAIAEKPDPTDPS